jgi:transposase
MKPATSIILSHKMKKKLNQIAHSFTAEVRLSQRAKIILKASEGLMNMEIASDLGISENSVSKWRMRFSKNPTLEALKDGRGRGRKETISVTLKYEVVKIACSPIREEYKSRGEWRWNLDLIVEEMEKESGVKISRSEIWSILNKADIKPHKVKMWQHSPEDVNRSIGNYIKLFFENSNNFPSNHLT